MDKDSAEFHELRYEYDRTLSLKMKRRRDAMVAIERELAAADQEDLIALAEKMHDLYDRGMGKMVLRQATRQYGSPNFLELWNAAPYTAPVKKTGDPVAQAGYTVEDGVLTVNREAWDWSGVEEETLTFRVEWSESLGKNIPVGPEDSVPHAMFNMKNLSSLSGLLNAGAE